MNPSSDSHKTPLDFEDDNAFGEWLHGQLMPGYEPEPDAEAVLRVRRAETALQATRFPEARRQVEVLWIEQPTAFTAPGRYIYIARDLLHRLTSEDAVAFVIAHELAHHDLGHLDFFQRRAAWERLPGGDNIAVLLMVMQRLAFSPEMERDADTYALDRCVESGYEGAKCLEVFDVLEAVVLDYHDVDMAYGPEAAHTMPIEGTPEWLAKARVWAWERARGYPSIQERRAVLQARLSARESAPFPLATISARETRALRNPRPTRGALQSRLDHIDRALEAWRADLSTAVANVLALTRVPTYRRLTGGPGLPAAALTGITQAKVAPALEEVPELCRRMSLLLDMLDRSEAARESLSREGLSETTLRPLEQMLLGASVPLSSTPIPLDQRSLLSPKEQAETIAPPTLLEGMAQAFEAARDAIFAVDTAWAQWEPIVNSLNGEVTRLEMQMTELEVDHSHELAMVRHKLKGLRDQVATDPLNVPAGAERPLQHTLAHLQTHINHLSSQRQQIEAGLKRARNLLQQMNSLQGACEPDPISDSRSHDEAIPAQAALAPTLLSDLTAWLDVLEATWNEGRWQAAGIGLERWLLTASRGMKEGEGSTPATPPA